MKTLFNCLLFCLLSICSLAQKKPYPVLDEDGVPITYGVSSLKSKIPIFLRVDAFTRSITSLDQLPNDSLGAIVYLENAQKGLVTVRLRKDSLKYYRYSITENDTNVLIKDGIPNKVNFIWNERSSWPGYLTMDLGITEITNKKTTIKIYRLPDDETVTTVILYNKPLRPASVLRANIIGSASRADKKADIRSLKDGAEIDIDEQTKGIHISMKKTDLDFAYTVHVVRNSGPKADHIDFAAFPGAWKYDAADGNPYCIIEANYFNKPGNYRIYVMPQIGYGVDVSAVYSSVPQLNFRVRETPRIYTTKDIISIIALLLLTVSLIATLIIFFIKRRSRNKIQAAQKKAESTKGQLDQIRSQLNPHFVYNSLSGIQNLMNQNEVESANAYLSKFARLTRNILNEQDRISIQDERSLLDDYLAMERLRFGFSYELKTDADTDLLHVEIPAMLLQPFVENACKHAMSVLGEKGLLGVAFKSAGKDLILKITDNGKGFDLHQEHEGLGLKLCRKRIDLLNQLYTECPVSLDINSDHSGTVVTITLKNWL